MAAIGRRSVLATVNGQPDVPVTLDSGSNLNLFGYTLARSLGIPLIAGLKPITSRGIGGSVDNYAAILPEMQIGSIQFHRMVTLVGPDEQVLGMTHSFWGDKQVMILGVNALHELSYLTIDNLRGNVIFGAREGYLPDDTLKFMTAVPLHWVGRLPAVDISVDAHEAITCILDTGGDYGMLLPRARANEWGYWSSRQGAAGDSRWRGRRFAGDDVSGQGGESWQSDVDPHPRADGPDRTRSWRRQRLPWRCCPASIPRDI